VGRLKILILLLAGMLVTGALTRPAVAQCRLCGQPSTQRQGESSGDDVQLRLETSLSFERLILSGPGMGAVTIRPDGSSGAEGAIANIGPRAMVGTVLVHGDAGRGVRVQLPRRIELYSLSGGRITLDDVVTDLPQTPRLDAAGNLTFRFGGRLILSGDADGQYRGDLSITVEYL
jgi:hypothetical protein